MEFVRLRAHQYQKFDGSVVQNAKSRPALWEPGGSRYAVFRTLPEVCRLVVQALVALGGDIPAEIALHAVVHEVLPVLLVIVSILCVAAGHIQLRSCELRPWK